MDIFNVLTLVGGLCLFLFGMNLMGQALERRAGGKLRSLLDKMTSRVFVGFLTGLGITAIIQSSSATTVMVVGFVMALTVSFRDRYSVRNYLTYGDIMNWIFSLSMFSMLTTTGGQLTCLEVSGFWPLTSVRMAFSMHL